MCFHFIFPINFVFLHKFFKRLQCAMLCKVVRKTIDLVMKHMIFWLKWPSIDKESEDFTHRIATQTHCDDFCHHLDHVQSHFRCTPSPNPPQDLIATCLTCLATVALRDPEQVTDNFFLLQQATSKGAFDMVFFCCHGYPLNKESMFTFLISVFLALVLHTLFGGHLTLLSPIWQTTQVFIWFPSRLVERRTLLCSVSYQATQDSDSTGV